MTGIGKTALAEKVVATLMDSPHPKSLSPSGSAQKERDFNPAPLLPGEKGLGDEGYGAPLLPGAIHYAKVGRMLAGFMF